MARLSRLPLRLVTGAGALLALKAAQAASRRAPSPPQIGEPASDPESTTVEIEALRADLRAELDRVADRAA